ncbi:MAG: GNAT family N-acetyltransferase [Brevibacterium sp.]|uniref:GNAT family N-acetyltransferase n=1 Tax=Brevibacterium sandarakinum TaxID=629680 RepID=UPI002653C2A8|nr:GNAT family N-acetyltransferase [Brevibacterium sandarakinum]MDN5585853.1 GNAT family N-acetyltransferase [Brevibacterium sp.]MDN5635937.1 GNAT family N-acetyltransferase [Brevibacterium sp.]MDN5657412.1 GNAT family N-acetyltransferase [Brevibacterium sandarakinum]
MTPQPPLFRILDAAITSQRQEWERVWERIGKGEIFSHPAYLCALADNDGKVLAAYGRGPGGGEVLYAFIRRPITTDAVGRPVEVGLSDLITGLVYGGPIGDIAAADDLEWFWRKFAVWARENGVVSEFIRFSPVVEDRLGPYPGTVRRQAPHVVRDLGGLGPEDLVAAMVSNSRRRYRRAIEAEYRTHIDDTGEMLDDFLDIYEENMDRVEAAPAFYFPREFFEEINRTFPGRFAYVFVLDGDEPVSATLMLYGDRTAYYYLSGCRTSALHSGAHVFAHIACMRSSLARGARHHVLTGGVTNTENDNLLRFKRHLVPDGLRDYLTGERIFLPEVYSRLLAGGASAPESQYFPRYRDPALKLQTVGGGLGV